MASLKVPKLGLWLEYNLLSYCILVRFIAMKLGHLLSEWEKFNKFFRCGCFVFLGLSLASKGVGNIVESLDCSGG